MHIQGTVKFIDLSGGFWGIETDDGQKFNPVDTLPKSFQKEGLRISAEVKEVQSFNIFMWGKNVAVSNLKKVG